jgi:hypothetical protein
VAVGEQRTRLAISARYRPPLGAVGRAADRVLLHRVAEATVKDFLDRVGRGDRGRGRQPDRQGLSGPGRGWNDAR